MRRAIATEGALDLGSASAPVNSLSPPCCNWAHEVEEKKGRCAEGDIKGAKFEFCEVKHRRADPLTNEAQDGQECRATQSNCEGKSYPNSRSDRDPDTKRRDGCKRRRNRALQRQATQN